MVELQSSTTSLVDKEADDPKAVTIDPHGGHMWSTVVTDRIANKQTRTV